MTPEAIHQVFLRAAIECAEQGATAKELASYLKEAAYGMSLTAAFDSRGEALVATLMSEVVDGTR